MNQNTVPINWINIAVIGLISIAGSSISYSDSYAHKEDIYLTLQNLGGNIDLSVGSDFIRIAAIVLLVTFIGLAMYFVRCVG